jgi:hypothetical protein
MGELEESRQRPEISYHEYRVIAHLLRAHVDEHKTRLKAMIAFGDLVTRGDTFDIDLLEIVEGWEGTRFGQFSGPAHLPLRGKLRLYFLTPEVFQDPALIDDPAERVWVQDLLDRVRDGYEIIMEIPTGWVRRVLEPRQRVYSTLTAPPSGSVVFGDPYRLTLYGE